MATCKPPTTCDFSLTALEYAATEFHVPLHDLTVYAPFGSRITAQRLQGEIGFALVLVPDAILQTRYTWAAGAGTELMWCEGCV